MKDKGLPKSIGEKTSEPISFPRKEEICERLDNFYNSSEIETDIYFSNMFRGALFSMKKDNIENNPDWMAQVAHSLREILYPFHGKWESAFAQYGSSYNKAKLGKKINLYYGFLNSIAHHNYSEASTNPIIGGSKEHPVSITSNIFKEIVHKFGDILFEVLRTQIDIHQEIDEFFRKTPQEENPSKVKQLISLNPDAQQYFFSKADEHWLDWLWENGFLDIIKQKSEDPTSYSYKTPELHYLVKVSAKKPDKVVEIMKSVSISEDNFNPEVIDQFLRICSILPVAQLKKIVPKIHDEQWIQLMGEFNKWGFEYKDMLQTLAEAKEYRSLLILTKALLQVKSKEEIKKTKYQSITENPFYLYKISETKVFYHLVDIDDENIEKAFDITTKTMAEIISLCDQENQKEKVFKYSDKHTLFDIDFFTLEFSQEDRLSSRTDMHELASVIKIITEKLIGEQCNKPKEVHILYEKYIGDFNKPNANLPDSWAMWRLRLFVLSLCPEVFKDKLKNAFFRLFKFEHYNEIISGAEYEKALQKGFSVLTEKDKRTYADRVIEYFTHKKQENGGIKDWNIKCGSRILSIISDQLTIEEKQKAEEAGFKLKMKYEPRPIIEPIEGGIVLPQGPMTQENFGKLEIKDIAKKLKSEWTPRNLSKQKESRDFRKPINAEGAGNLLRNDIPKRLQQYIERANLFFDKEMLDPHYTYSFIWGIKDAIKENKESASNVNWNALIEFFIKIKDTGNKEQFGREKIDHESYSALLTGWNSVHSALADVIQELLTERNESVLLDFRKYRNKLLIILRYLLNYPDPKPEDEEIETAKSKIQSVEGPDYLVSDPFTIAINSVRGRAFQAFTLFVYQDGKRFAKQAEVKINKDVQEVYSKVLKKENTRALMFMFGHYLPTFYFRNTKWIQSLLQCIFPLKPEQSHLYLAAWEGYLANNLYEKMFFDPNFQALYEQGLNLQGIREKDRKYFKDPDEGLAAHLALAHMHYADFGDDHELFKLFWEKGTIKQHSSFVIFIGLVFISGKNPKLDELLKKKPMIKKRIKKLWEWLLENYSNPELFRYFGLWISLENNIFELKWLANKVQKTLIKTEGDLDWGRGLIKSMTKFAYNAPEDTLIIIRSYLLGVKTKRKLRMFYLEQDWIDAFRILYKNYPEKTRRLISDLIKKGGQVFWPLKNVLE